MATKYNYSHRTGHSHRLLIATLVISFIILLVVGGLVFADLRRNSFGQSTGSATFSKQAGTDNVKKTTFKEPTFSISLPGDWKEVKRVNTETETSVTWQAEVKGSDNRFLKVYTDKVPLKYPVVRLLPVSAQGSGIEYGEISDDCAKFTGNNASAKWRDVNFTCGSPASILPETGTGTTAPDGKLVVSGPEAGAHSYFFLYTDQNIQPDYAILYDALQSFIAK